MLGVASAHQTFLAATLFILRTAIARANVPCVQSIIFESVLPKHRGRWTATCWQLKNLLGKGNQVSPAFQQADIKNHQQI